MSGAMSPRKKSAPQVMKSVTSGIQVMIRCRPFNKREKEWFAQQDREVTPVLEFEDTTVTVLDPANEYEPKDAFAFHSCYWSCVGYDSVNGIATQEDVYSTSGRPLLDSAIEGYNGTVFAYGQTGSGKTYSMLGGPGQPGISYLLIRDLFAYVDEQKEVSPGTVFTVEISFMEIYNEQVRDLFNKKAKRDEYTPVKIRQHPVLGIQVEGLQRLKVTSAEECEATMERGVSERTLAETKMNATSSRSHAICQISLLQINAKTGLRRNSLLNIVDLAGSERLKMTGAEGTQLMEAKNINQSLSTLRKVFDVLIDNSKKKTKAVPPYRESMLTWVLKESLGGNSQTFMIAAVSPCEESIEDTISTLRYAQKAKAIVNKVIQNEQPNAKMVLALKNQVEDLQRQLKEKLASTVAIPPLQLPGSPSNFNAFHSFNADSPQVGDGGGAFSPRAFSVFENRSPVISAFSPRGMDAGSPMAQFASPRDFHSPHRCHAGCEEECELTEDDRRKIRRKFESQISATRQALKEAEGIEGEMKERQRELEGKVVELEGDKIKLTVDVSAHRKKKFSQAFRSAFRIQQQRMSNQVLEGEILDVTQRHIEMTRRNIEVEQRKDEYEARLHQHTVNEAKLTHRIDVLTKENSQLQRKSIRNTIIFTVLCAGSLLISILVYVVHFGS